jgi:hypothetical protein
VRQVLWRRPIVALVEVRRPAPAVALAAD